MKIYTRQKKLIYNTWKYAKKIIGIGLLTWGVILCFKHLTSGIFVAQIGIIHTEVDSALEFAANNRMELEKVLSHYKDEPEKLEAARFLITNMPGHMSQDSGIIARLQPLYDMHVATSEKYDWIRTAEWKNELDSLMQTKQEMFYLSKIKQDARLIKASYLIREIDRSFQAWKENAYSKDLPFDDFCRYILPYRFSEYIYPDHARELFYERHAHYFNQPERDFRDASDTLLFNYVFLMHNDFAAASLPVYSAATFEYIKRGSCEDKAWFNCLLMSALGMAVTIDFVPHWGDRSGRHTWNSLLIGGETHPFEPFWDVERWKYKTIYNNETYDLLRGKFRLPKVYRQTYERHIEGPMADKSVPKEDIPSLFRNPFMTDVSSDYFKTTDVQLAITKQIPRDTRYCYLCVFNTGEWKPVQWGEIQEITKYFYDDKGHLIRTEKYTASCCAAGSLDCGNPPCSDSSL